MRGTLGKMAAVLFSGILMAVPQAGRAELPITSTPNLTYLASLPYLGGSDLEFQDRVVGGVTRSYLYAGSLASHSGRTPTGLRIVDITDPWQPVLKSFLTCQTGQNDIQVVERGPNTYVILGTDTGGDEGSQCFTQMGRDGDFRGLVIVDVTDVSNPKVVSHIYMPYGAHNSTVHPGGRYLYVSEADLANPRRSGLSPYMGEIQVIDLINILRPVQVKRLIQPLGGSSHDITFNASGTRAYSAAITNTMVLDTVDPANPKLVSVITDPSISIHHQADPYTVAGRDYLLVTDELGGGGGNAVCPGGGVHVFDISSETMPTKVGAFFIPEPQFDVSTSFACTSHVLRIYPEQNVMTIAWYGAGTWVVDVSDPRNLRAVAHANPTTIDGRGADTWSAKMHRGHIYTNDIGRGIDVFRYDGPASPEEMKAGIDAIARSMRSMPRHQQQSVTFEPAGQGATFCFQLNSGVR